MTSRFNFEPSVLERALRDIAGDPAVQARLRATRERGRYDARTRNVLPDPDRWGRVMALARDPEVIEDLKRYGKAE